MIAIVEDDKIMGMELAKLLEAQGYKMLIINNFNNVVLELERLDYDLLLLDINLGSVSGFDICKEIRKSKSVPIIFVTSRNTTGDELRSIKVGGMDFISKPYNKSILLEKIKRALNVSNPINYREITKKGLTLDLHLSLLKYRGNEVELTRNEFRVLYYFFSMGNRIITKDELIEYLWNDKYYLDEGILLVLINRLRKKTKEIGITNIIKTARGRGYYL